MKGNLRLDAAGSTLDTPEGETLSLYFSGLSVRSDGRTTSLADSRGSPVAMDGELVTVWGGLGADASMIVCAVEERHGA
jgi:hypothetical protein